MKESGSRSRLLSFKSARILSIRGASAGSQNSFASTDSFFSAARSSTDRTNPNSPYYNSNFSSRSISLADHSATDVTTGRGSNAADSTSVYGISIIDPSDKLVRREGNNVPELLDNPPQTPSPDTKRRGFRRLNTFSVPGRVREIIPVQKPVKKKKDLWWSQAVIPSCCMQSPETSPTSVMSVPEGREPQEYVQSTPSTLPALEGSPCPSSNHSQDEEESRQQDTPRLQQQSVRQVPGEFPIEFDQEAGGRQHKQFVDTWLSTLKSHPALDPSVDERSGTSDDEPAIPPDEPLTSASPERRNRRVGNHFRLLEGEFAYDFPENDPETIASIERRAYHEGRPPAHRGHTR